MNQKNESMVDVFRLIVMWIATGAQTIFGKTDGIFLTLLIFMFLDYLTGVMHAVLSKQLSSKVGAKGIAKKMGILCIVSLAAFVERYIIDTTALRSAVILYYISNEGISIFENIAKLGVPIPKKLRDVMNNLTEDDSDNQSETE